VSSSEKFISLQNITKSYNKNHVLKGLNFECDRGQNLVITGKNGAGKSTLLKIISGFIVNFGGSYARNFNNVSAIIETPAFMNGFTGHENLEYILDKSTYAKALDLAIAFGLLDYLDKSVHKYSTGMKQKLALSAAFARDADLFVLDEPFDSLDHESVTIAIDIINSLRKNAKSVIIVTHNLSRISDYCDEVLLLKDGILQSDSENAISDANLTTYRISFLNNTGRDNALARLGDFSIKKTETENDILIRVNPDNIGLVMKRIVDCSLAGFTEEND
jgi:ABC-2 type transport system ATP-binding protein